MYFRCCWKQEMAIMIRRFEETFPQVFRLLSACSVQGEIIRCWHGAEWHSFSLALPVDTTISRELLLILFHMMGETAEPDKVAPPKLVVEMLPAEDNNSLFERIKNVFPLVKRKTSDGASSTQSDLDDRRDSLRSNISLSSIDLSNRRASSASTFGNRR